MDNIIKLLADELSLRVTQVEAAVNLIDEGNTIPFIARYRKEATGSLDDTQLRDLDDRLSYLRGLQKRREEVLGSIEGQGLLTDEIAAAVAGAKTLAEVEDIYRPFKPKRKTRASVAKEKGLQPLADRIFAQQPGDDPLLLAAEYIDEEKGVSSAEEALQGAQDIIAEAISDDADIRGMLRGQLHDEGVIVSTGSSAEPSVYSMYFDFSEPVAKIAPHRVLAINRGEKEDALKVSLQADDAKAVGSICYRVVTGQGACSDVVRAAAQDSYDRLIFPSLEREIRSTLFETASEQAIKIFALNLKHLLMQPPVKDRVVLAVDPAYRTGCKIAVVDGYGKVLDTTVIYPTPPQSKIEEAKATLKKLIAKHGVSVISIGNGTASKESEIFVADLIKEIGGGLSYMVVSEAGASVYSASKLAAQEFPQFDVSLRSAVSIARRLQDPLAELVKIDPKAIGIGQYQHDMPQNRLGQALGGVVENCVNSVGVDLNTASFSLLEHVAGINSSIAKNIVSYREEKGGFSARNELLKVDKLGKKAYEQCAGFLRLPQAKNRLDATAVHPESYGAAKTLLDNCGFKLAQIGTDDIGKLPQKVKEIGMDKLAQEAGVGIPTLHDIMEELLKPGRDPRDELPAPMLRSDIMDLKDLKPDMVLTGTIRNVTDFGAFVDLGVHQDGLVHISRLADKFVKHPADVVKVGDIVKVKVLEVDTARNRISLTMKGIDN